MVYAYSGRPFLFYWLMGVLLYSCAVRRRQGKSFLICSGHEALIYLGRTYGVSELWKVCPEVTNWSICIDETEASPPPHLPLALSDS
jgi:hypothetical protein